MISEIIMSDRKIESKIERVIKYIQEFFKIIPT